MTARLNAEAHCFGVMQLHDLKETLNKRASSFPQIPDLRSLPTATSQEEVDELKVLLFSLLNQTKEDYVNGKFTSYNEFTTGTGFHLANIKDAMEFNNNHEGIHLGFMMNIRKFI